MYILYIMVRKAAKDEVFIIGGIDDQMKRRLIIALVPVLRIASFGALLNKISFDPDFSLVDALTGATKDDDESEKAEGAAGPTGYDGAQAYSSQAAPDEGRCLQ